MGNTKKNALANDLMDELLDDTLNGGHSDEDHLHDGTAVDLVDSTGTFPIDSNDDFTARLGSEEDLEDGTQPIPSLSADDEPSEKKDFPSRAAVGRAEGFRSSSALGSPEAALAQSENLRIAQDRILELEREIERLRVENEELGAAGETLRRKSDELLSVNEDLERRLEHEVSTSNQEKEILKNSRDLLRKEVEELKQKNSELEIRISTNIQRVRVRERELENRLELSKVESKALIRSKDEMILDLKRQIDQLNLELNNYRVKSQDLNKQIAERQDTLRRTVKALRLALSMMEGEEQSPLKKAK